MKYEWISMRSKVLIAGLPNVMIYSSTFANDYDIVPPSTLRNNGDGGQHGSRIKLMTEKSCTTIHCCQRNHSSCRTVWMVWDRVSWSWEARKSKSKVVNLRGQLAPIKAGMIMPIETRMIAPIEGGVLTESGGLLLGLVAQLIGGGEVTLPRAWDVFMWGSERALFI